MTQPEKIEYYTRETGGEWVEVNKASYIAHERAAQCHNPLGDPDEPATTAFSGEGYEGRIAFVFSEIPELP